MDNMIDWYFAAIRAIGYPGLFHHWDMYFGSYASLQGWDNLTPSNTLRLKTDPMWVFEHGSDPIARASETIVALAFLRRDVKEAVHTVALQLNAKKLFPNNYLAAVGDDYAKLAMLCHPLYLPQICQSGPP